MIGPGASLDTPRHGPGVLVSKPARALLAFWVLLALVLLVPSPVRDRILAGVEAGPAGGPAGGSARVPGVPAPAAQRGGGAGDPAAGADDGAGDAAAAAGEGFSGEAIQDPKGAMAAFYDRLARTEAGKGTTRVLHYGDSLIDLDHITGPLRARLQRRFGDAGHGFVLAAKPWRWYNHHGIGHAESRGWKHLRLVGGERTDGYLGLGAAAIHSPGGRRWAVVTTTEHLSASRVAVHFLKMPGGGTVELEVDGERKARLSAAARRRATGVHRLRLPDTPHRFRLITRGKARLFGLVLERDRSGITWENLTLVSARFHQLRRFNAEHWQEQLQLRDPHLVVFQFGANDTLSYGGDLGRYGRQVGQVLGRMRAALPDASCLVIGPLDRLQRDGRGRLRSPRIVQVVSRKQREVALAAGCAFWDGQQAMGGPGAMKAWMKQGLTLKDRVHLNVRGSKKLARRLEAALLHGLRQRRAASGRR